MSITINNFSLAYDEWSPITDVSVLSVDVTDPVYSIVVSGTNFYYNNALVSGTFTAITDGYRLTYTPGTISSGIDVMVQALNSNSDTEQAVYNMLFGYHVVYDERITFDPAKEIDVYMKASNEVLCINEETEAFYYITKDLYNKDFTARVYPVVPQNLGAEIRPQSTAFYYDMDFKISVSGIKDFAGNEMPVYTFSFKIENPEGS